MVEVVRSKHRHDAAHVEAVKAALAPLLRSDRTEPPATIPDPFGAGTLHVAVTRFGVGDDHGVLVAGSRNADFPTEQDRLLLGVGANQTAIVVQRRRAEEQVQEQREWLRVTLASIGDAVITTDTAGPRHLPELRRRGADGLDARRGGGQTAGGRVRHRQRGDPPPVENPVSKVLAGRASSSGWRTTRSSSPRTGRSGPSTTVPPRSGATEGEIVGCVLVFRDITEKKRAEAEVRASEVRFRTLFESMDEGFCVIEMLYDAEGPARRLPLPGSEPDVREAHRVQGRRRPDDPRVGARPRRPLVRDYGTGGGDGRADRFVNEAKAMGRWYDVYAYRVGGPGSRKVGVLFTDITARKQAEDDLRQMAEALEDADRRKDEFLATLAHELRNPLAPIRNGLQVMRLSTRQRRGRRAGPHHDGAAAGADGAAGRRPAGREPHQPGQDRTPQGAGGTGGGGATVRSKPAAR